MHKPVTLRLVAEFSIPPLELQGRDCPAHLYSSFALSELAFRLDQNSSDRSHEPIGGVHEVFQVLICFVFFRSRKRIIEALHLFGDPIAQTFTYTAQGKPPLVERNGLIYAPEVFRSLQPLMAIIWKTVLHKCALFCRSEGQADVEPSIRGIDLYGRRVE